jgi:hypothetical protein
MINTNFLNIFSNLVIQTKYVDQDMFSHLNGPIYWAHKSHWAYNEENDRHDEAYDFGEVAFWNLNECGQALSNSRSKSIVDPSEDHMHIMHWIPLLCLLIENPLI